MGSPGVDAGVQTSVLSMPWDVLGSMVDVGTQTETKRREGTPSMIKVEWGEGSSGVGGEEEVPRFEQTSDVVSHSTLGRNESCASI